MRHFLGENLQNTFHNRSLVVRPVKSQGSEWTWQFSSSDWLKLPKSCQKDVKI